MKKPTRNIPASILARLKSQARITGRPFAEILQYYAMERFLFRLSKTKYADKFILKGGLLFYAWNLPLRRPTKDIDFRGYISHNNKDILKMVHDVISEPSSDEDGLVFDLQSISVEETQIDADYQGIRAKLTAFLRRSKIPIQIDVGFSDEIASKAERIEYPNILPELKATRMKGYPKESVIAEKFHAMIRHAELNSRMKDYYDVWLLAETFEFECQPLQKAIETTFKKRETELPVERPVSLTAEFASKNETRWNNFLNKLGLEIRESNSLTNVIERIWEFLKVPINKSKSNYNWIPTKGWK
jgi:predicted nucleotidyltransferase component of viral defense system